MSERYQKLFQLEHRLYASHAPVLIESGMLLLEQQTGSVLCQLCFRSIQDRPIKGLRVEVQTLDAAGNPLGKSVSHRYQDLDLRRDATFGKGRAIVLPEPQAKAFTAQVSQVSFVDGQVWTDEGVHWAPLPDQLTLEEAFYSEKQQEQFLRRFGDNSRFAPLETDELWFCTCGGVNRNAESRCHRCHLRRSALLGKSPAAEDPEEDVLFEDPAPSRRPRRRRGRALLAVLLILLLLALAAVLLPRLNVALPWPFAQSSPTASTEEPAPTEAPETEPDAETGELPPEEPGEEVTDSSAEDAAEESAAEPEETPAHAQSVLIPSESPAADAAVEPSPSAEAEEPTAEPEADPRAEAYDQAVQLQEQAASAEGEEAIGLYQRAAEAFEALDDYLDSDEHAKQCRHSVEKLQRSALKADYEDAKSLLNEGKYAEARTVFLALGDYEDSADMAKEAVYRKGEALLQFLNEHPLKGAAASLSVEEGDENLIFIPQEQQLELGIEGLAALKDCFGQDPCRFVSEGDPDIPTVRLEEAAAAMLDTLGDYRSSVKLASQLRDKIEKSDEFFTLCAAGDLEGARDWLNNPNNTIEDKELWLARINRFLPYAGAWKFNVGDRNLVSYIGGGHDSNYNITCVVILTEDQAILRFLVHEGDTEGPELHCELDEKDFYKDQYWAKINDTGSLIVALYEKGKQDPIRSTEYVRPRN